MYEELVARVRDRARREDEYYDHAGDVINEAADAIENLSGLISHYGGETGIKNLQEYASKYWDLLKNAPRWIPVTDIEHLPNTDSGVVGYFGGGAFNQLRWYDFVTTLSDGTFVSESTERDVINDHCIAVCKLPEPPKEET